MQSQSTFAVQGAATATNETISLTSGHLYIGNGGALADPGRQFLAPITMYSASTVTLEDTKATSEVFWKQTGQLDLFDKSSLVAQLTVHNASGGPIWATSVDFGGVPSVMLTATADPPRDHIAVRMIG